jgi:hypothetical protein
MSPSPPKTINIITTNNWLKITPNNDPETEEIKQKLIEGKLTTNYFCQNDILFRKINPGRNPPIYRAFVRKGSRLGLLRMFHDELCHLGPDKTFAKINHYFWFPGMTKFVKKYCDHCLKCIVGKKYTGPKHSLVPTAEADGRDTTPSNEENLSANKSTGDHPLPKVRDNCCESQWIKKK